MGISRNVARLLALAVTLGLALPAVAQKGEDRPPSEGGMTYSLGLPGRNLLHGSLSWGSYRDSGQRDATAYFSLATYRDFIHPAFTFMGWWGEIYGGYRDTGNGDLDGGLRGMVMAPGFRLGAGVDFNLLDTEFDAIFSLKLPLRRGGLLGHGTAVRADWLPGRGNSFNFGIEISLQRYAGQTRPRRDHVKLPKNRSIPPHYEVTETTLGDALANVREGAHWINRLTVPFLDHKGFTEAKGLKAFNEEVQAIKTHMASTGPLFPDGRTIHEEVRVYHNELDRAFSIAASGKSLPPGKSTELGREVAEIAREVMLEVVLLPYDRLLGQRKKNDSVLAFAQSARGRFTRRVDMESNVRDARKDAILHVFQMLLEFVEENRKRSRKLWDDARLVWIPMQYALRPEQHDTQVEMDRLIERATNKEFSDGNQVYYIINEKFQHEAHKMIIAAEDYHVFWIHDFRGVDGGGDPDEISFLQVLHSYFAAMTERVRKYDETGKFPLYLIIQDQLYYEVGKSRLWHELLMNPLHHKISMPTGYDWMEAKIDSAQNELREAVANSRLLQSEALEYGEAWLRNRIKVHISITHPADASFSSRQVLPLVGIHDTYIRDHRKISFYDITEDDPYKGRAIYTGMGIGEHYVGATWEDRGILARGPALLTLKYACRDLLLRNGYREDQIPYPLRPRPKPLNYADMLSRGVSEGKGGARAMELHNVVGYGPKPISVMKAMIYTLMPPGSVLLMPDFVWHSPLWGSMAVGGALRGTRSLIVFPDLPNQPTPSALPQSRARELFHRLVVVQQEFADPIAESGGMLKTGFYNLDIDVKDIRGRVAKAGESYKKYPWLVELVKTDKSQLEEAGEKIYEALDREGYEIQQYLEDAKVRHPQLHMKSQFYASGTSWDTFFSRRKVVDTGTAFAVAWARQLMDGRTEPTQFQVAMAPIVEKLRKAVMEEMTPEELEKGIVYLSVGSQNMDYRGMYLDGEVVFVSSRGGVLTGVLDLLHVIESSDWVEDVEELDAYMGSYGWLIRHLGRLATPLM